MKVPIEPIRDERSLRASIERCNEIWGSEPDTPEGNELDILMVLIEDYERREYPTGPSDPISVIRHRMIDLGLTNKDLVQALGHRSVVSEVLSRKRRLTSDMILRLKSILRVDASLLLGPTDAEAWEFLQRVVRMHVAESEPALAMLAGLSDTPGRLCLTENRTDLLVIDGLEKGSDATIRADSVLSARQIADAFDVWVYARRQRTASTRLAA